jgi:hypothetical protein
MAIQYAATAPRRSRPVPKMLLVSLVLPFAILVAIIAFSIFRAAQAKEPVPPGQRGSLVWGDGIFSTRTQVKAWLLLHGGSYTDWAKHHPAALKLLVPTRTSKPAK